MLFEKKSKILGVYPEDSVVFLLAAGRGSRLGKLTEHTPKVILELPEFGSPLQYWFNSLTKLGFTHIAVNLTYLAEKVINFIEHHLLPLEIIYEPKMLGGLNSIKSFVKTRHLNNLMVVYSDVIFEGALSDAIRVWAPDSENLGKILLTRTNHHGSFGYVKLGNSVEIIQKPKTQPNEINLIFAGVLSLNSRGISIIGNADNKPFNDNLVEDFLVPNASRFEYWYLEGSAYDIGSVKTLEQIRTTYAQY